MRDRPASDSLPDRLGRYRILETLGRGGMGVVYRAEDPQLGRHVALKLLPDALSQDASAKQRLRIEARAASALDHPHICTVYEVGETQDGRLFIAMACYDGHTLADRLASDDPLSIDEAVAIAQQIASGLGAAHRKGIIHRDLKPSNIFLCDTDPGRPPRAKVLDFGVAKVEGEALTRPGATLGTVQYAAPEQARGEVEPRSDLWSLGVVLYEMLAGRRPFNDAYDAALLYAILNLDPEPLQALRPEVPESVAAVVHRLLQKDPADRFERAEDVVSALADAPPLTETAGLGRERRRGSLSRPVRWSALAGIVVLAVLGLWMGMRGGAAPALPEERHIAVLPLSAASGDADAVAFADGLLEVIVTELTGLERYQGALQVIPTSEIRAQDIVSASQAKAALGATLAVTGRVEPDPDGYTVRLNLEDATTLRQIASTTLSRPRTELVALRDDVLAVLAQMLDVELQPAARAALAARNAGGTENSAAYDAYVRGLGFMTEATPDAQQRAFEAFEAAVRADSRFAIAHARLAEAAMRIYEQEHEPTWVERASTAVDAAVTLAPEAPNGWVARARLYTMTGRYDEAVRAARQALGLGTASDDAYIALASAYAAAGDPPAAEAAYLEAIARNPGSWEWAHRLGLFYYTQGQYEDALASWTRVVQLVPRFARAYSNIGAAYLALGQSDSASVLFERSAALYPSPQALSNLAAIYYYDERYAEAARATRRALDLDDNNHEVWNTLAATYERLGDSTAAQDAYREAIIRAEAQQVVNARDPELLAHLATYYVSIGDTVRARTAADEAVALDPEGEVAFFVALAYEQLTDRGRALQWVGRALEGGVSKDRVEGTPALSALVQDARYRALSR